MFISSAFAQTAPAAAAAGGDMQSTLMSMLPLLLMFAVMVLLVGLVSEQVSSLRFESRG